MTMTRKARQISIFAKATHLGLDYEVSLLVRFKSSSMVTVSLNETQIQVTADVTGNEGRVNLVTECLEQVAELLEARDGEPPTKMSMMVWEKALNDAFARALL